MGIKFPGASQGMGEWVLGTTMVGYTGTTIGIHPPLPHRAHGMTGL